MLSMELHWCVEGSWLTSPSLCLFMLPAFLFFNYIETGLWKLAFLCLSLSCVIPGPDCFQSGCFFQPLGLVLLWTTLAAFNCGCPSPLVWLLNSLSAAKYPFSSQNSPCSCCAHYLEQHWRQSVRLSRSLLPVSALNVEFCRRLEGGEAYIFDNCFEGSVFLSFV